MAKNTGAVKHTHQYFRRPDGMWACSGIDGCTHYMPKNMSPLPVGMMALCWVCGEEFRLTPLNMRNDKPKCDECTTKGEQIAAFEEHMREKMQNNFVGRQSKLDEIMANVAELKRKSLQPSVEEDQIEVIEADETHKPNCETWEGGICTCNM